MAGFGVLNTGTLSRRRLGQPSPYPQPQFHVQPAPGGSYHVYPGGHKVFVRHSAAVPSQATPGYTDTGFTPSAGAAAAQKPAAPAPAAAAPAADPSGATLAPDSTYLLSQAASTANLNDALAANDASGQTNQATFTEALRRLSAQQPLDEQSQREGANRQGLFYSGYLGSQLGKVATSYAQKRADAQGAFQTQENARLAARAALQHGYNVETAAAMAAAADRQIGSDQTAAGNDALAPDPGVAPPGGQAALQAPAPSYVPPYIHPMSASQKPPPYIHPLGRRRART